jgi:hypothetical protein
LNPVYYFYAANGRDDSATAYALGDPGAAIRCRKKDVDGEVHAVLQEGITKQIPCGRDPNGVPAAPGWIFGPPSDQYPSTLDLLDTNGKPYPVGAIKSLVGFCCDNLIKEE